MKFSNVTPEASLNVLWRDSGFIEIASMSFTADAVGVAVFSVMSDSSVGSTIVSREKVCFPPTDPSPLRGSR